MQNSIYQYNIIYVGCSTGVSESNCFSACVPGFPLDKAVSYAKLRNPLLINDLNMQYYIQDRSAG